MEKGLGIRALIPTGTLSEPPQGSPQGPEQTGERVLEVPVGQIAANPFQPRKQWSQEELAELVESIRQHGILQPLIARRSGPSLELVAGERRLMAAHHLGLATVPVIVREATNREMLELALVENLQREDMNPADAAEAYRELMTGFNLTQEQVAERVGKSRPTIANAVRLLSLPPAVLESLRQRQIDTGHARALLGISDPQLQHQAWRQVVRKGMSVRQTEALAARLSGRDVSRGTSRATSLDPNLQEVEQQLTHSLSARVRLRPGKRGSGVIEIEYADGEELDRIYCELLGRRA